MSLAQESKRGIKRKRWEGESRGIEPDKKLPSKLHHGLKEVTKAVKKAKTFETQKLVKKLKQLRTEEAKQSVIDDAVAQLDVLKHMDVDTLAQFALKSKLKKDRILSDNEHMHTAIGKELPSASQWHPAVPGTPAAHAQARLLSSKHLAVETSHIVEALRSIIQPETLSGQKGHAVSTNSDLPVEMKKARQVPKEQNVTSGAHSQLEFGGSSDHEGGVDDGWESGTVGGDGEESNEEEFESRLDEQDSNYDSSADSDGASEGVDDLSDHQPKSKIARPAVKQSTSNNASTFLPSLSVGYIRGDSDDSDDGGNDTGVQPRKNRRGQRARRAIWEKKYGRNAKHKQKEIRTDTRNSRNSKFSQVSRTGNDRAAKIPAKSSSGAGFSRHSGKTIQPQQSLSDDHRLETSQRRSNTSVGSGVHPSWEAKRKAREKESASILPSQGKKIVFS